MRIDKKRKIKIAVLFLGDIIFINLAYLLSYYIRFSFYVEDIHFENYFKHKPFILTFYLVPMACFKMYRSIWHIAGFEEFLKGVLLVCF